jgi:site-specific DNA-methyltransferase (adenine-specific)
MAHFATFGPELITPCILAGSTPDDIVLDPFFGIGTVGYVARKLGRAFMGIELKRAYAEMALTRLGWDRSRLEVHPLRQDRNDDEI